MNVKCEKVHSLMIAAHSLMIAGLGRRRPSSHLQARPFLPQATKKLTTPTVPYHTTKNNNTILYTTLRGLSFFLTSPRARAHADVEQGHLADDDRWRFVVHSHWFSRPLDLATVSLSDFLTLFYSIFNSGRSVVEFAPRLTFCLSLGQESWCFLTERMNV